ncbi:PepSY domain-containing protein [Paenibacillus macerans]|nr:PepSY domain-containing protein [Paenibacillus macerans]MBS5910295.1 PepSY domain-containing protein [Paenibacillus macerans]UMV49216.1 PepSY domain-containing protein [Paenibacillus macerans]SUA86231.1 propeptide PepSY amd peptidase M4 [Paenibacillus macerans]
MMKRKMWVGAMSAALLLGATTALASAGAAGQSTGNTGTGATAKTAAQSGKSSYITIEQAKAAALKAEAGRVEDVELKRKSGKVFYDIEIEQAYGDVDVHVDAVTGKVLAVKDREHDDDDDDRDDRDNRDNRDYIAGSNKGLPAGAKITSDQASEIAVKQVNGATVTKVELDYDDGRYVYEVELKTELGEADVDIDAVTGKVYSVDEDFKDWD